MITVSENVITMSYDEATRTVTVATTNADTYFFYIETQEEYETYEDNYLQDAVNEEVDSWISTIANSGYMSYYTFSGNLAVEVVEFLGNYAATDDYVALAAPVDGSDRNGDAKYLKFHFDYIEGIENTEAPSVNAFKRLIDGQLIIEKNGVKYNAIGTIVK